MISDSDYKELLNKYNILVSKYDDLAEINKKNKEEWERKETDYLDLCDRVKELCEMIYNKSPEQHEMKYKTMQELVHSTKLVFEEYSHSKNEIIRIIVNESENKSAEIENLKNKVSQLLVSNELDNNTAPKEVHEYSDNNEDDKDDFEKTSEKAGTSGKLKVFGKKKNTNIDFVQEDDEDAEAESQKIMADAAGERDKGIVNRTLAFNKNFRAPKPNIPRDIDKKKKDNIYEKVSETANSIKDVQWELINAMAEKGHSRLPKIIEELGGSRSEGILRQHLNILKNMGIIAAEPATNPFSRNLLVYSLTEAGIMLYKYKSHKNPVKSEKSKIITEHDNLEHGYGILFLYELMSQDKERFADVSMYNRNSPIIIDRGQDKEVYIPDIMFKENGKQTAFYEYERGNQGQLDYEKKFDKMLRVSRYIYVITDSKDTLDKMARIVDKWVEKKNPKELDGYKLKICTALYFKDKIFTNKDTAWQIEYDFSKSKKPLVDANEIA